MTLQAYKTDIGAYQHPRIRRAMRLVTRRAAFKAHRCVFECKGTPFVAMTREAPRSLAAKLSMACRILPCGLWQSIDSSSLPPAACDGRALNWAQTFKWPFPHCLLIASALRTASGGSHAPYAQAVHEISFLAWLLSSRPICVG